ncbi:N-acetylglucosamine-6-phosphate deacetylase [Pseudomonas sp. R2.Fl]|nr:N-acetylglucosamine-6-phosphate deacetylase [Pseudomonas sp. R2.Fl]
MSARFAITAARLFDGERFLDDSALIIGDGRVEAVVDRRSLPAGLACVDAGENLIVPGFVDLQVNGGGGVLFNNDPTPEGIRTICAAHARFGTTALMVTLITDTPALRDIALEAGTEAAEARVPGFLGLHLEGPHLSATRKGTHDPGLIRPMTEADLALLTAAAGGFGLPMITVAPESVTPVQIARLVTAGYRVSLGHTDTTAAAVAAYIDAGASLVTHLFNAMSQLGNREPGLVGAALDNGALSCGLIADGFHVDPISMRIALAAKRGPGRIFLVTDAMSSIGSDETGFELNGRHVYRRGGRLTLADGTLAGADIDMLSCVRFVRERLGLPLEEALRMASLYPADAVRAPTKGRLAPGSDADFLLLSYDLDLVATYIAGLPVHEAAPASRKKQA